MAYFNQLPSDKQDQINESLLVKIRAQHDDAYEANLAKAKSKQARNACSGRYEGSWWRLWNAWREGKVSNLHIHDCLRSNITIGDIEGVNFQPAGKLKPAKNIQ